MDIQHPDKFKQGVRVLMRVSRNKDLNENKTHDQVVSYSEEEFNAALTQMRLDRLVGQRIYASASTLNPVKAMRKFREDQLQSEFDQDPLRFYKNLEAKWISALMKSEDEKQWLFDCDTHIQTLTVRNDLKVLGVEYHTYLTKAGRHYITNPFNPTRLRYDSQQVLMKNPLMLWSYT